MADATPESRDSAIKAWFYGLTAAFAAYFAYQEYQRWKSLRGSSAPALRPPTFPGRVVHDSGSLGRLSQGAYLNPNVGDETIAQALARVRSRAGLPRREEREMRTVEERLREIGRLIHDGSRDDDIKAASTAVLTRKCGEKWCVSPKDWVGEGNALYEAVVDPKSPIAMRYTLDHPTVDEFGSAQRGLRMRAGDCFAKGTLVLRDDHQLVPIEELQVGQRIWGHERWSTVQAVAEKGILEFDAIQLNNGSWLKLTSEHKVWMARCGHEHAAGDGVAWCSVPMTERRLERVRVSELQPGMVLVTPEQIPFGAEPFDEGRAYIEGLYVADGSSAHEQTFEIAGQDGCPKEAQKREVEAICRRLGIPTTWQRKYLSVRDKQWTQRLRAAGTRAAQKHVLSIGLHEAAALELLRGLMADSGVNTSGDPTAGMLNGGRTFTTTSYRLAVQTRVLLKMAGLSCGWTYIEDHGGLGKHPIFRLFVRQRGGHGNSHKLLRVKTVERHVISLPAFDITTDDHFVYLPEADVSVSQCDDLAVYLGSMLAASGHRPELVIVRAKGSANWSHILLRDPVDLEDGTGRGGGGRYRYLDPSFQFADGWMPAGYEPPGLSSALSGHPGNGIVAEAKAFRIF